MSGGETSGDEKTDASDSLPLHALKRKRAKRVGQGTSKEETEGPVNEELKALEAHMLSLSKQGLCLVQHADLSKPPKTGLVGFAAYKL